MTNNEALEHLSLWLSATADTDDELIRAFGVERAEVSDPTKKGIERVTDLRLRSRVFRRSLHSALSHLLTPPHPEDLHTRKPDKLFMMSLPHELRDALSTVHNYSEMYLGCMPY